MERTKKQMTVKYVMRTALSYDWFSSSFVPIVSCSILCLLNTFPTAQKCLLSSCQLQYFIFAAHTTNCINITNFKKTDCLVVKTNFIVRCTTFFCQATLFQQPTYVWLLLCRIILIKESTGFDQEIAIKSCTITCLCHILLTA